MDGGPPVRPLDRFYNRVHNGQLEIGPRFSVNSRAQALLAAQPGRAARRHRWDPVPVAADDPEARLAPTGLSTDAQAQDPPSACSARPASGAAASRRRPSQGPVEKAAEAGIYTVDWIDERTSLSGGLRWLMFRKVPKGTNWFYTLGSATMFAFLSQAITGVFLAMYYTPSRGRRAYESVRHINDERLPRRVRARHAQVGLDGDDDPDLPAHGPHVLLRGLQVPARAQLGHRRGRC